MSLYQFNPVPSGGAKSDLDELISRVDKGMDEGLLPVDVFSDDNVFRAEMTRIYGQAWLFVAHETEIPNAGDYVLRKMGIDQVIVSRDAEGGINVMLNHCRHRGTEVAHEEAGNTRHFKCPYHGWTYNIKGEFAGAPHFNDAYDKPIDKKEWGLRRAPKVESFHGFIFASLSDDKSTLRDYLGEAAWMLEAIVGLHPQGMRALGAPERFRVHADWKNGAENFAGDAYHVSTAHLSAGLSDFIPDVRQVSTIARGYEFNNGHSFIGHNLTAWGPDFEMWAYPKEIRDQFDLSKLDEVQKEMIKNIPPTIGTIFPNLSYLRFPQPPTPGEMPVPFTMIRLWQPVSPGVMELWTWQFEYACVPEEMARTNYLSGQYGFGSGGIFEQDDTAVWEGIVKAANSPWNRRDGVMLHYQQRRSGPDPEWKGPGKFHKSIYGEYLQELFWRRWVKDMSATEQGAEGDAK